MKQVLFISVYLNDDVKKANKPLFKREVFLDDSFSVNFQSQIDSLRSLFGVTSVISFELSTY